jgi:hypothetical protein
MTATKGAAYTRKAIMANAHFMARWREGNGKTYRARFAEALRYEWKKAKAAHSRLECALGLPIRSCPADAATRKPAGIFAGVRPARRLYTTQSGRLAGSFAA